MSGGAPIVVMLTSKTNDVRAWKEARQLAYWGVNVTILEGVFAGETTDPTIRRKESRFGIPVYEMNRTKINSVRAEILKSFHPSHIHCHELEMLMAVITRTPERFELRRAHKGGDMRALVTLERPDATLIYETHEFERGRPLRAPEAYRVYRQWVEDEALKGGFVDAMVCTSDAMADAYRAIAGPGGSAGGALPIWTLWNVPPMPRRPLDPEACRRALATQDGLNLRLDAPWVAYFGGASDERHLDHFCGAAREMDDVEFVHIGQRGIDPDVDRALEGAGIPLLSPLPYPWAPNQFELLTLFDALAAVDVSFIGTNTEDYRNSMLTIPNKLHEAAAAGCLVVCGNAPPVVSLVERWRLGVAYDHTVPGLVNSLRGVLDSPRPIEHPEIKMESTWEFHGEKTLYEVYR